MSPGLYLHIPFCPRRCHFCAFYLDIYRKDEAARFLESLHQEIALHGRRHTLEGNSLDSVYFGGGTPTTLGPEQLQGIVTTLRRTFIVQESAELTVEAHPDTVSQSSLIRLAEAGFNRISFGLQTTDPALLQRLGRSHRDQAIERVVSQARQAGFTNINLDLMYGLPGQTLTGWQSDLDEALSLKPTHLSCYALTIEEKTALHRAIEAGLAPGPDSDLQLAMEEATEQRLAAEGFEHYELSNFCRPGYACRHNLHYWNDDDYLGLGPSAQSYLGGCRFGNPADLEAYHRALRNGRLPSDEGEPLTVEQRRRERLIFGLR
ncbi:MAG: radical SAM family heme chaperone HemW, partial [Nitrospirales bacterium]